MPETWYCRRCRARTTWNLKPGSRRRSFWTHILGQCLVIAIITGLITAALGCCAGLLIDADKNPTKYHGLSPVDGPGTSPMPVNDPNQKKVGPFTTIADVARWVGCSFLIGAGAALIFAPLVTRPAAKLEHYSCQGCEEWLARTVVCSECGGRGYSEEDDMTNVYYSSMPPTMNVTCKKCKGAGRIVPGVPRA
jgi:hypothetical protein